MAPLRKPPLHVKDLQGFRYFRHFADGRSSGCRCKPYRHPRSLPMSHAQPLYQRTDRVQQLFPDLHPHHPHSLAWYSFGAALARHGGLTQVVAYLAGWLVVKAAALRARLRELYLPGDAQRGKVFRSAWTDIPPPFCHSTSANAKPVAHCGSASR